MSAVIYEVTLRAQPAIAADFAEWLHAHVVEMLALPGFIDARISRQRQPEDADVVVFCCHYRLRDADALDDYLREHAPRMREDGLRRFPGGFVAQRRVLEIVADL